MYPAADWHILNALKNEAYTRPSKEVKVYENLKIIISIDKLLNYVDTYQAQSPEKRLVISEVQRALAGSAEKIAAQDNNNSKFVSQFP